MKNIRFILPHYTNFFASILLISVILLFANTINAKFFTREIILLSILGIISASIFGILEKSILRISLLSCLTQTAYFLIDFGVALAANKPLSFATIHFINFSITGFLFAIILSKYNFFIKSDNPKNLHGLFNANALLTIALIVSCFSQGGLPGFNIFIGEYLIYIALFQLNPFLMVLTVFASLLAFIFYFRLVFLIFAGKEKGKLKLNALYNAIILLLIFLTIFLGIYPKILLTIALG